MKNSLRSCYVSIGDVLVFESEHIMTKTSEVDACNGTHQLQISAVLLQPVPALQQNITCGDHVRTLQQREEAQSKQQTISTIKYASCCQTRERQKLRPSGFNLSAQMPSDEIPSAQIPTKKSFTTEAQSTN
eukprot:4130917-Amphidinium_carterae.1